MEKLQKRSDGFYETPSGQFAVIMKRGLQSNDGKMTFSFRPSFTSSSIKVEWKGDVAFFTEELAKILIAKGYAELPTAEQVGEINEAITNKEQVTAVVEKNAQSDKPKETRKEPKKNFNDDKAELPTAEQVGEKA